MTDGPTDPPADPVTRRHGVAVLVILLVAAALRIYSLSYNSFWIDELYMLEYSAGNCHAEFAIPRGEIIDNPPHLTSLAGAPPVTRLWTSLGDDQHPPLYYVCLRLWRETFGSSDAAVRSLSVVASLASVLLLFDVGRFLIGPTLAIWPCLLLAMAQPQVWIGQEARSYALVTATLLGAAVAVVRIEVLGFTRRRAIALAGCLLATMLTHYFGVAGCMAIGVYALCRLRGRPRLHTLAAMGVAALVYAVIWGPFFLQQLHGYAYQSTWLTDPGPGFFFRWARRLLTVPYRLLLGPVVSTMATSPIPFANGLIILLPFVFRQRRTRLLLPALCVVALVALPAGLDLVRHTRLLLFERYFAAAAPFLCLLAVGLPPMPRLRQLPHFFPATILLYALAALPSAYYEHNLNWRALARTLADAASPGDVIVYHSPSPGDWYAGILYFAVDRYAPEIGSRTLMLDAPASPAVLEQLHKARSVWLVTESDGIDVPRVLPGFVGGAYSPTPGVGRIVKILPVASGISTNSTRTVPGT